MSMTSFVPLFKTPKAFFHDAETLANETTGFKPGDKLSWKVSKGSISPEIFRRGIFQNATKSFYSADDGRSASIRAIQWSLGYVVSGNRRKHDNSLFYQGRLTEVFTALALTYSSQSKKTDSAIAAQNYSDAARIIEQELSQFPPKTEVDESDSEDEASSVEETPQSSQSETTTAKQQQTMGAQTLIFDVLSRIEPNQELLVDFLADPLQPQPPRAPEPSLVAMRRALSGLVFGE